jgi:crossover junction endodeoxyribonuclease RusA
VVVAPEAGFAAPHAEPLRFVVHGAPVPQGSLVRSGQGMRHSNARALEPYRREVSREASKAMNGRELILEPVRLELVFTLARPKGHYGTGRNAGRLRRSAPAAPITKPDIDKLARAVLDALTGIVFRDDAQVVELEIVKRYGAPALEVWLSRWWTS